MIFPRSAFPSSQTLRTDAAGSQGFLADAIGSTVALVDSAGVVQIRYTYDAFGSVAVIGSPDENSFQFTGRENDGPGLYYYRTRYYHAGLQRFLSEDPIGLVGGLNLYRYAGNNPIRFNDQFGLCQIEVKFSPASGLPIGASHPQIVTTDPSGNQNFYEANAQY
ncbi:MAG: hypothetical protein DMD81_25475, partial [Candidatus Rokuibacteriota bacterium]